jgi:hypothetical protein
LKRYASELAEDTFVSNLIMTIDVTAVLQELLANNRGPDPLNPDSRQPPKYGVSASLDGSVLAVVLTFQKDCAYCCMEWGCHLALYDGKR